MPGFGGKPMKKEEVMNMGGEGPRGTAMTVEIEGWVKKGRGGW